MTEHTSLNQLQDSLVKSKEKLINEQRREAGRKVDWNHTKSAILDDIVQDIKDLEQKIKMEVAKV